MSNDFNPQNIGTSFQAWLEEEGISQEVHDLALQSLIAEHLINKYPTLNNDRLQKSFIVKDSILFIRDDFIKNFLSTIDDYLEELGVRNS